MYILKCLYDQDNEINLCFGTRKSAEEFRNFVSIYMDDTGAGNGYGAYWLYEDEKIRFIPWRWMLPKNTIAFLDRCILNKMLKEIMIARLATKNPIYDTKINVGCDVNRNLVFSVFGSIPSRQEPEIGDMYRIPRSNHVCAVPSIFNEGRVLKKGNYYIDVASVFHENQDGSLKSHAVVIRIPKDMVIKINDYMGDMYKDKRKE